MAKDPFDFAAMLRRHRRAAGLTQEELAESAGLSLRGIAALEGGERRADVKVRLANVGEGGAEHGDDRIVAEDSDGLGGRRVRERGARPFQFARHDVIAVLVREDERAHTGQVAAAPLHLQHRVGVVVYLQIVVYERAGAGAQLI